MLRIFCAREAIRFRKKHNFLLLLHLKWFFFERIYDQMFAKTTIKALLQIN